MDIDSYIKLPSAKVISLCEARISRAKAADEVLWKENIQIYRNARKFWRNLGMFWLDLDLTDEEIKNELKKDGWLFLPSHWTGHIQSILRAAKATDFVYLSVDDYSDISK